MAKLVVTTGQRFTDIDGLACVIGYGEIPEVKPLLVIPGPFNQSITQTIKNWSFQYQTNLESGDYEYVLVDVSEATQFASFVDPSKIVEIYDHHYGQEKFWREKLGEKAKIEAVGACATLIWEEFCQRVPEKTISSIAANLLYTAIMSNTLNFKASITTERDKKAFSDLKGYISLPSDWVSKYYLELEADIFFDPQKAISQDTKIQVIEGMTCAMAQVEMWNSADFVKIHADKIQMILEDFGTELWLFTSPSIEEGRNYILTNSQTIKDILSRSLDIRFEKNVGITSKLWLRKEILKMIQ